jgi:hypothetical protein
MKHRILVVVVALLSIVSSGITQDRDQSSAKAQERITREVRHEH